MSAPLTRSLEGAPLVSDWLDFGTAGVVRARSGKVELGQGIELALRQIVADALDVDLAQVALVAGDTRECPDEIYTAGSMSVEVGGRSLRAAGAAARAVLLAKARELLQAPEGPLAVSGGAVMLDGRETGLDWWRLAAEAATDVPVSDWAGAEDLRPRGGPSPALAEAAAARIGARLTGGAYIHDLDLADMVHARVLPLPHPQARLAALDTGALEAMPGVIAVHRDGSFVGVIAESEVQAIAAAERAARLAAWEIPDGGASGPAAVLEAAGPAEVMAEAGDPGAGTREVRVRVSRPFVAHASIGTCCALAEWRDGRLTVWTHAQGSHPLRAGMAAALGLGADAIDVIHAPGAGCYGHNGADDAAFEAALLARAVPGRPVRLVWGREEELTRAPLAPAMETEVAVRLDGAGRIAAMTVDVTSAPHQQRPGPGKPNFAAGPMLAVPVPPAPVSEPPPANGGGADRNGVPAYAVGGFRLTRRLAADIPVRTSAMRALGATVNVTAIELAMDAAADAAGADPVAFRLAHLEDGRGRAVLERAAALAGFDAEAAEDRAMGIAVARYKNKAGWCAVCVEVEAGAALRVPRLWAVADVGEAIDPEGVLAQVEGGAVQALSWTLKEEMPLEAGAPAARDWEGYPILRFSEVPEVVAELIGDPAHPPLGAGEIAQGPTSAAVACAVRRLFGTERIALPLTPDRLAAAILDHGG